MNFENIKLTLEQEFSPSKVDIITEQEQINWDGYDYIDVEIDGEAQEYRVIKEESIERIFEEYIEQLVDDCYLPDLPQPLQQYFDYEKFTNDCAMDGYGHHLNGYDGAEIKGN